MRFLILSLVLSGTVALVGCDDKPGTGKVGSAPDTKGKPGEPPPPPPPPPPPK